MAENNTFVPYEYVPVIDSTVSGFTETDYLTITFCIPKSDTVSTGAVIKIQNPITGTSLLKDNLLYIDRKSFIEETTNDNSTLQRFKVQITNDQLITAIDEGSSYQCWIRMTQVEPEELKCDHEWSDWEPTEGKKHRRVCPRCGKKEVMPCEFERIDSVTGNIIRNIKKNKVTHKLDCLICNGNGEEEEHYGDFYLYTEDRHKRECPICAEITDAEHIFEYTYNDEKTHSCMCQVCFNQRKTGATSSIVDVILKRHIDIEKPYEKCDLCNGDYILGKAEFIANQDDSTRLDKIIIFGSGVEEIIIPAQFKTISSDVICLEDENASSNVVQEIKNMIKTIAFDIDSVCQTIEDNAFGYCEQLTVVDLPDTIQNIGQYAFTNNEGDGNDEFTIYYDGPQSDWDIVNKDNLYAPLNATINVTPEESQGLNFIIIGQEAQLAGRGSWQGDFLVIPKRYNGIKVTSVSTSAFQGEQLKNLFIPNSINVIKDKAFKDNVLNSISFSLRSKLADIEKEVFMFNEPLTAVDMSMCKSLKNIDEDAFRSCFNLNKVKLSSSLESINAKAFYLCPRLEFSGLEQSIKYYIDISGSLYEHKDSVNILLIAGYNLQEIDSSINRIAAYAFAGRELKNKGIYLPDSIIDIEEFAFESSYITWIRLPSNLTVIKNSTFSNCLELKYVDNLSVTVNLIEDQAFGNCPNLYMITYTGLRKYFYYNNDETWPQGTTKQPYWNLNSPNIQMVYEYVESKNPTTLTFIDDPEDDDYCIVTGCVNPSKEQITEIIIPFQIEGKLVRKIQESAFANCYYVERLVLPESIEEIADKAFQHVGISAPSLLYLYIPSRVKTIGKQAFTGMEDNPLPYIDIKFSFNNQLREIKEEAFAWCSNILSINFGEFTTLQSIGNRAFYHCPRLWLLEFPYTLETIGEQAFAECNTLERITFPYDNNIDNLGNDVGIALQSIGKQAFLHCDMLNSVTLTESVVNNIVNNPTLSALHQIFKRSSTPTIDEHFLSKIYYTGNELPINYLNILFTDNECHEDMEIYTNWTKPNFLEINNQYVSNTFSNGVLTYRLQYVNATGNFDIFLPRYIDNIPVTKLIITKTNTNVDYLLSSRFYLHDLIQEVEVLSPGNGHIIPDKECSLIPSKRTPCSKLDFEHLYNMNVHIFNSNLEQTRSETKGNSYEDNTWSQVLYTCGSSYGANYQLYSSTISWFEIKENNLLKDDPIRNHLPSGTIQSRSTDRRLDNRCKKITFPKDFTGTTSKYFSSDYFIGARSIREVRIPASVANIVSSMQKLLRLRKTASSIDRPEQYYFKMIVIFENGANKIRQECFCDEDSASTDEYIARPFECYLPDTIVSLENYSFYGYNETYKDNIIYYAGTPSQWEKITKAADAFNPEYMPQIVCLKQDPPQTFRMIRSAQVETSNNEIPVDPDIMYEPYESLILEKPEGFSTWSKTAILSIIDIPKTQIDPVFINAKNIGILSGLFSAQYDNLKWYQIKFDTGEISDRIYPKKNNVFDYTFIAPDNATSFKLVYMTKKGYYATIEEDFVLYKYSSNVTENNQISVAAIIEDNAELGSLDIKINVASEMTEDQLGHLFIERASVASQFTKWETLRDLWLNIKAQDLEQSFLVQDLFAEPGVPYKYRIQFLWNEDSQRSNIIETVENSILTAEDVYLTSKDLQMRICYDARVSGVKRNVSDSISPTLGSRYPVVRRNGKQDYVTFTLSGLISYNAEKFTGFDSLDIVKMEDSTLKEKLLVGDTENDLFKNSFFFNTSSIKDYYPEYYQSLSRKHQELILEKIFRDKVMNFLYGDDVKLFKSITEGNKLVRLTNVAFTPNEQLGRNIYSFSATATEVADCTIDNCRRYLLQESEIMFSPYDYDVWESGKIIEDNVIDYYSQPQEILGG